LIAAIMTLARANFRKIPKTFLSSHAHAFDRDRSAPAGASSFTGPSAGEKRRGGQPRRGSPAMQIKKLD
jgi:hypothetical protein